jgi:hypothetical protein
MVRVPIAYSDSMERRQVPSDADDRRLEDSYRSVPLDEDLVAAARRLAALTAPEW